MKIVRSVPIWLSALAALTIVSGCEGEADTEDPTSKGPDHPAPTQPAVPQHYPGRSGLDDGPTSFPKDLAKLEGASKEDLFRLLDKMIQSYSSSRTQEVKALINEHLDGTEKTILLRRLAMSSVREDPAFYREILSGTVPSNERSTLIRAGLMGLGAEDVRKLLVDLSNNGFKQDAKAVQREIQSVPNSLVQLGDNELRGLLTEIKADPVREVLARLLGRREVGSSFGKSYQDMVSGVPDGLQVAYAMGAFDAYLAPDRKGKIAEVLSVEGLPDGVRNTLVSNFASLATSNYQPLEAFEIGSNFPESAQRDYFQRIARDWVRSDGLVASDTALKMEAGLPRDLVASEIIHLAVGSGELDTARSWIPQISDANLRAQAERAISAKLAELEKSNGAR